MEQTTNYNLKKPEYTDFADIQDINDNMDTIDELLAAPTGDTADSTATFTCSDVADGEAAAWTNVPALTSGETHKSIFAKMSQMFKNLRYLYKLLGTTDISSIGNGTVTDGLSSLNDSLLDPGTLLYSGVITEHNTYRFAQSANQYARLLIILTITKSTASDTSYFSQFWADRTKLSSDSVMVITMVRGDNIGLYAAIQISNESMYTTHLTKLTGISSRSIWCNVYGFKCK